ncbi:chaperone protein dnaJ 11 [Spatholobus suberectus]|nr:chaperone protein dnaJ 11 [Spatholobus suberectus]
MTEEKQHKPASYLIPQSMVSCTTLYDILGIHATASVKEIKTTYRQLARVYHPDVVSMG